MKCRWMTAAVIAVAALADSCERRVSTPPIAASPSTDASARAIAEPRVLLSLPVSAYHATLAADDDDAAFLLTPAAAYRLSPAGTPERTPLDLGAGATMTRASFLYWSRGAIVDSPRTRAEPHRVVALAQPPQAIVAAGERIAWLQRSGDGRFSVQSLIGKSPRTVYASAGSIDAIAAMDDAIFFVERPAGSDWRIGRVPTAGGPPAFTPLRKGRAPAMLVAHRDLTYYDGNGHEVRRLSPDLQHERSLASGFVCSPIAVSAHVYCAQVEGLFELRADERPRRLVPGSIARVVTDLAATPKRLLWILDAGADRLEVRELALSR
jgi:hypothetical protein